jgi:hypothetical protein
VRSGLQIENSAAPMAGHSLLILFDLFALLLIPYLQAMEMQRSSVALENE